MAEVIALPRKPTIHDFIPYQTKARVNVSDFISEGTLQDTNYQIEEGTGSALIVDATLGAIGNAALNFTVAALNLALGEVYSVRLRRKNETGWGGWSKRYQSIVHTELTLPPNAVRTEPISATAQPIPFTPDFIGAADLPRELLEKRMQTGHIWRRLKHTSARYVTRMQWNGLSYTEKTTLVSFLKARLDAEEPFETSDFVHGSRKWFTRQGQIHDEQTAPLLYSVLIECDQSKALRYWTVGTSTVEGPDKIL